MNAHNKLSEAKGRLDGLLMLANSGLAGSFGKYRSEIYAAKDAYFSARIEMLNAQISELERAKSIIMAEHEREKGAINAAK